MTLTLMEVIKERLETTDNEIYNTEADPEAKRPYVIFALGNTVPYEVWEDTFMDVDIWSNKFDECISMTDEVDKVLNGFDYESKDLSFIIYKTNRLNNIPDKDTMIRRSRLSYVIRVFRGE